MLGRQEVATFLIACLGYPGSACTAAHRGSAAEATAIDLSSEAASEAGSADALDVGGPEDSAAPKASGPVAVVAWRKDADLAASEANKSGRPLLVYLRAEWCVSCLELERAWRADAAFERASRSFVPLWIDATDEAVLAEVSARFGALRVPSVALIDANTGRRAVIDSRPSLDHASDSVLAFVSKESW